MCGQKESTFCKATISVVFALQKEKKMSNHIVDCDVNPFVDPEKPWWKVLYHKKGGQLELDFSKIKLYLSPNQLGGKIISGHELFGELRNQTVLNANVLYYLLAHPEIARKYQELKKTLIAKFHSNRDAYTEGKASFIESNIEKARLWKTKRHKASNEESAV